VGREQIKYIKYDNLDSCPITINRLSTGQVPAHLRISIALIIKRIIALKIGNSLRVVYVVDV